MKIPSTIVRQHMASTQNVILHTLAKNMTEKNEHLLLRRRNEVRKRERERERERESERDRE